jgi:hypothetical protein
VRGAAIAAHFLNGPIYPPEEYSSYRQGDDDPADMREGVLDSERRTEYSSFPDEK